MDAPSAFRYLCCSSLSNTFNLFHSAPGPSGSGSANMASRGEVIEMSHGDARGGFAQKSGTTTSEVEREPSPVMSEGLNQILRVRKLFNGAQIFAFSLTYMSIWESMNQ
jgi:hypothetical protein